MSVDIPEEYLARLWDEMDWEAAREKLAALQKKLTLAAFRHDEEEIVRLQKRIVRDIDIKCLAVRHVTSSTLSPGVDRVRWKTSAQKMAAAMELTSKDYKAQPLRQIVITARNTGKERRQGIPTYHDRAMNVLYSYSLVPVTEAMAERKSFAFRPGRSTQDALSYVYDLLGAKDAPEYVVCADIKAYYANIQHDWLLEHVPMDKKVLAQFLNSGIVFAGELFPADGTGISEGANISPYLGNFVLDGMQRYIYQWLYGTDEPADPKNGDLIRYADDVLVMVRTPGDGDRVIECLEAFLAERGLTLSEEKTRVVNVNDGFTFLSRTFVKKNGIILAYPADAAVDRFIDDICSTISTSRRSQRKLIELLNQKLTGWGNYHRYSDALDAFRRVDAAVQTALLDASVKKHPRLQLAKVIDRYWYADASGKHYYCLPDDKSVRVVKLADTPLLVHRKVKTNANPYVDPEYSQARIHDREVQNVTGRYRAVWERQGGICHYCGRPILADQPRATVTLDLQKAPSVRNCAYIHKICEANEYQVVRTMEDVSLLHSYDMYSILEGLAEYEPHEASSKKPITPSWKHYKLKEYFASCTAAALTLSFEDIERIEGKPLPKTARADNHYWYHRQQMNSICEAWRTEGYSLKRLDMKKEKITLHRDECGYSKLVIPDVLTQGRLPDNAVYEMERYMEYIIKKYALVK